VGGASHDFREKGALLVEDGSVLHGYEVEFLLMRRKRVLENTPSLLGRNIMNRWKITFDYANRSVIAEIRDSDVQIPLPDRM
jgi:hypothetical protein